MTHEAIADGLGPVVQSVAADMARRYGRHGADVQEMARVACRWITEHAARLDQLRADYPAHWASILRRILTSECRLHGEAVKAYALGYQTHDVFWYSRAYVEKLLPALFDPGAWREPPVSDDDVRFYRKTPGPGGGWVTLLADVSRAFARLPRQDQTLLRLHYQADKPDGRRRPWPRGHDREQSANKSRRETGRPARRRTAERPA